VKRVIIVLLKYYFIHMLFYVHIHTCSLVVMFIFHLLSNTEVRNMLTKIISKSIVTTIKRIARRNLNSARGYELIDLPTLSMGHCLLASGVPSYSGLHRVNASNYCIEFRIRAASYCGTH